jgi:WD40 repeat protein/serine/threonine protein kinase
MACLDENALSEFTLGLLGPEESESVERHVAECEACRAVLCAMARSAAPAASCPPGEEAPPPDSDQVLPLQAASTGARALQPGTRVDSFLVLRRIGQGGMGEVYLARDTQLGRRVALKMIRTDSLGSAEAVQRFLFEARTTALFSHPHIVTIHAVGSFQGYPYLALEYLEGHTLQERIIEERPSLRESLRIGLAIAEALNEAHRHQILHRDLKPANVILPKDGRPRVVDFGLAKILAVPHAEASSTVDDRLEHLPPAESRRGHLRGSPLYMAPEQWRAEAATDATDIWALGAILYQLRTGTVPYPESSMATLFARVTSPDPAPRIVASDAVEVAVAELIARCLEKDPRQRPSANEVGLTLEQLLLGGRPPHSDEESPFRGLFPFAERHAASFFGRDSEVAAFLERVREATVLPVAGPSGVGKSSFVLAGVLPRLREQGPWTLLQLRPGRDPFRALADRLARGEATTTSGSGDLAAPAGGAGGMLDDAPDLLEQTDHLRQQLQEAPLRLTLALSRLAERRQSRVLLFVDQMEELFALGADPETARRFVQSISGAADDGQAPIRVVFTIRDDFLYRLAAMVDSPESLAHVFFLRTPDDRALHTILTRPLETMGYGYDDPQLPEEMIHAVRGEAAGLPLLQFSARRLWEARDRRARQLRRSAYEAMGGVLGALAQHAESVIEGLSGDQLVLARQLLLRLVTPEGTRSTLHRGDLLAGLASEAAEVLSRLTQARLVVARRGHGGSREGEVELVHESLVQAWARLRRWVEEEREGLVLLAEINEAATLWERRGMREEELWQGRAIEETADALERSGASLPGHAARFLEAAYRRERRRQRGKLLRRAVLLAALGMVAAASLVAAWAFDLRRREAERHRAEAERQERTVRFSLADALREGARAALAAGDPLEARAKLRRSLEIADSLSSRSLWRQLGETALVWQRDLGTVIYGVALSPDGRTVAVGGRDRSIHLLDTRTGTGPVLPGNEDQVICVSFSPDGKRLASGTWRGQVRIWDPETRRVTLVPSGHTGIVRSVSFSPDGRELATASADRTILVLDTLSGGQRRVFRHDVPVMALSHSPDGRRLAWGDAQGAIHVWRRSSHTPERVLQGHAGAVNTLLFSSDGRRLAAGSADTTVSLWEVATGEKRILRGHTASVNSVDFSPDGRHLASGGYDEMVLVWETATGRVSRRISGHRGSVSGVRFTGDGRYLITASADRTIRLWDLTADAPQPKPGGHTAGALGLSFSPDGRELASGSADRSIRLWDVRRGASTLRIEGHSSSVSAVGYSPDGKLLASSGYDQTVRLWDLPGGRPRSTYVGHTDKVRGVDFRPDGRQLASWGDDRTVRLWQVATGAGPILLGHDGAVLGGAFSPDGRLFASASADRTVRIWNVSPPGPRATLRGHSRTVWGVSFSPDGKKLVSGSEDGTVRLWDTEGHGGKVVARESGRVYWLAFHPGGKRIGVPTSEGVSWLLDLSSGQQLALPGHRGEVDFLRFSPDGSLAATSGDDGTVRLFRTSDGHPVWRASALLARVPALLTHAGWIPLGARASATTTSPLGPKLETAMGDSRLASPTTDGRSLCLQRNDGTLERWDVPRDERLYSLRAASLDRILASEGGCVILAGGTVSLRSSVRIARVLAQGATAAAWSHDDLLVAASGRVLLFDGHGSSRGALPVPPGATALTRVGSVLVLGFVDGRLERVGPESTPRTSAGTFVDSPSSPVLRLAEAPGGTLAAGYASGVLAVWDPQRGVRLTEAQLHGAVIHLALRGTELYAASELGDHVTWDLSAFRQGYCDLLRHVWRDIPVVYGQGAVRVQDPPAGHPCFRP